MKPDKIHALTLEALETLIHAAERVDSNMGHDEQRSPCDWNEWVDLRRALSLARHAMAREGKKVEVLHPLSVETQGKKIEDYK
jgi:hypothetical protein